MSSVLIEKVLEDFRRLYAEQFGECFRTEIRDTDVFICGIHQSRIWKDPEGDCAELTEICELFEEAFADSLDRSVATPNPIRQNPLVPPTTVSPFDGVRWPQSVPPAPRLSPSGKSMKDEAIDLWGNENQTARDSYNVPI